MTAPITPDERAAMRALADRMETYYGEADAASGIRRLLDALDTAEAEAAEVREGACVWCDASRADCARWRSEQRACCPDCAHASHGPGRAATSPVWDEDTVTEAVARAMFPHFFTDDRQPLRVFTETRSDAELREAEREAARHRARQALAVVREHALVRPDREALRRFVDSFCDDEAGEVEHVVSADGTSGFALTGGNDAHAVLRKAASALWPGESRATVQAETLRDAAGSAVAQDNNQGDWWDDDRQTYGTPVEWLRARADRLEKGADRG